jgi:hypothetical protein
MRDDDTHRGLYRKYTVTRTNGSSGPGGKHEHCRYFVLDLEHDHYAFDALSAYAEACKIALPELARDLRKLLDAEPGPPNCGCREAGCPHSSPFAPTPSEVADRMMQRADRKRGTK